MSAKFYVVVLIGLLLAVLNILTYGIPFMILISPFVSVFDPMAYFTGCFGEHCWGYWMVFGSLLVFITSVLIGLIMERQKVNSK